MKITTFSAALGAVSMMLAGAAQAQTCQSGCNDRHAQCSRGGGDYGSCMAGWRQCRSACLTPAKGPAGPAPVRATPAVVRR